MGRLSRFLRKLMKVLGDSRGVSLYETTAVVAMTAIVGSFAAPMVMDRIENAKSTKAANEVLSLNDSILKFFEHTGRWPGEAEIRRAGSSICFLQTGVPGTDPTRATLVPSGVTNLGTATNPFNASSDAAGNTLLGRSCTTITPDNVLNINDFLVRKPSVSDYPNWQGPYLADPLASDPWDRAYIINVLPLIFASEIPDPGSGQFRDAVGPIGYAWIITAGPDRLFQTPLTSPRVAGIDDVGKNMGARIVKSAGGLTPTSQ